MSLTEIRKRIEEESKDQVKRVHSEAQKEKENILEEARHKAKEIAKNTDGEISDEMKRLEAEQSANTELSAREIDLIAREEALKNEINKTTNGLIKEIKGNNTQYKKIFLDAVKTAAEISNIQNFRIIVNKKDAKYLEKSDAHLEYRDISGLIIESQDRSMRIDATLEKVVDSKNDLIKSELLNYMFSKEKRKAKPKAHRPDAKKKTKAKKRG